jgi:DNA-binding NarL/FixJ family response regulator
MLMVGVQIRSSGRVMCTGFDVVGQVGTADELMLKVRSYNPDIAIIDIRMPPTHTDEGLQAAKAIRAQHADVAVLVLSQYVELGYATELLGHGTERVGYLLREIHRDRGASPLYLPSMTLIGGRSPPHKIPANPYK